jgi:hypothetical protein
MDLEQINGITLADFASVRAFLERGKPLEELLAILGVSEILWEEAASFWQGRVENDTTLELAERMNDIFNNPGQGRFENFAPESKPLFLERIPDFEIFMQLNEELKVAATFGIDAESVLAQYAMKLSDLLQAMKHWGDYISNLSGELMARDPAAFNEFQTYCAMATEKFRNYYEAYYSAHCGEEHVN